MRALLALLLLSTLAAPGLLAQRKIEFTEFTLKNGLHVILHQDNSTPIVAVNVLYKVGSKDEDPNRTGFAHFFEHLLFEGSKHLNRGDFDRYLQNAGGTNNATTDADRTLYFEILPSNQLELGLWLESERLLHARILDEGVETQREVVKEERRLRLDNQPYGSILEETMKRAYTKHPYRWTPIGSMEHLNAATLDEFMAFYEKFYVPENAVLVLAGDINIKKAKKLVKKYFKDIPRGKAPIKRVDIVEPPQTAEVRDVVYDRIQLPGVVMAYKIPAMNSPDSYAVDMLMRILSRGNSSRLNKEVVDRQQKAVFAGAFPLTLEHPGVTIFFAIASMGTSIDDLEASVEAQVERVKNELVSEREFQKLQNQIENDALSQNASMAGIATNLATYHMMYGDTDLINEEIKRYRAVTREDLKRVANEYLKKESRVVLHYLPESQRADAGGAE